MARELVVPAIMLAFIAAYVYEASDLTAITLIFPGALICVILATLAWSFGSMFLTVRKEVDATARNEEGDETTGPIVTARPWLLVVLPLILIALFEYLGGLITFIAVALSSQLAFGLRPSGRGVMITLGFALFVYLLLHYVLYVRFPAGILEIG